VQLTERQHTNFWAKVEKTDDCWNWTGAKSGSPTKGYYGMFGLSPTVKLAHRVSYETTIGPVPVGLQLDHLCRNTLCVNPAHLEPVTAAENVRRAAAFVTRCPHGHAYDEQNTWIDGRGRRNCKKCRAFRKRRWRAGLRNAA
jgi:hypothetical protein